MARLALPLLFLTACPTTFQRASIELQERARFTFVHEMICPESRVVTRRLDTAPPADIARDPERLAVWRDNGRDRALIAAEGCGAKALYDCSYRHCSSRTPAGGGG
jgi:hypothetical protein